MPTYRLILAYEGTRYHGWQEQKSARSVAGELRRAVEDAGARVRELGGSGRTDAGVHALAQVAHLRAGFDAVVQFFTSRRATSSRFARSATSARRSSSSRDRATSILRWLNPKSFSARRRSPNGCGSSTVPITKTS
jgi:tRNA U38,U39,U40 pseudouridine synthase TruA